jgi:hypothetical protein
MASAMSFINLIILNANELRCRFFTLLTRP